MKTSELAGSQLDLWVAKADGRVNAFISPLKVDVVWDPDCDEAFMPSSDWADGGPIIESERISVIPGETNQVGPLVDGWIAEARGARAMDGPTPLIAAMRAYVASKFGEDVGK
ncbi:phage protein NinX family protein [Variovorax saccharolyticus]|uniref:phage protein NinX family protein n=1 Tax=Variovorax saccharolyticus TaxID=3053516 RepID=UPI0025775B2C|nr:phage protein NinX family protein [Variovorax sp. J31P216]MDM0024091.1 DUF2591 family protein [Variovorax sp. J31P216]